MISSFNKYMLTDIYTSVDPFEHVKWVLYIR